MASDEGTSEGQWAGKIDDVRKESQDMWLAAWSLKMKGLLTMHEVAELSGAFNDVFRRAGLADHSGNDGTDAMTYALYRDAAHQFRAMFNRLYPDLVAHFNEKAPPRRPPRS
jgi:hypothetical protein